MRKRDAQKREEKMKAKCDKKEMMKATKESKHPKKEKAKSTMGIREPEAHKNKKK
jgi:hypothetical protein